MINKDKYIILIVDDDEFIHDNLRINLRDIKVEQKKIELLNAYSGIEAGKIIEQNPHIAVIILDVMMEEDTAGLNLVNFIRKDIKNTDIRILLHTGQPGIAPKKDVADQFMIDGYLDKNTTDNEDCYAAVKVALRSYEDRLKLKNSLFRDDLAILKEITNKYNELLNNREITENYHELLTKINSIVHLSQEILASYALSDLKNDLPNGTTKLQRLSQQDYSSLIQIYDLKTLLIHTTLKDFEQERLIMFDTIYKISKNFANISILPHESKRALEKYFTTRNLSHN